MSAEPILDIPALLAPIPGEDPAGKPTPFDVRQKLDEARKEIDPATYSADDPMRPTEFQRADWPTVVKVASTALRTQSKDLLLAVRLLEALVKLHGFVGLRDGFHLLTEMLNTCWDRLVPTVDDPSDLDIRAGPFEWLDDPDRGGRFPSTIRLIPLIFFDGGSLSWADWKHSQDTQDRESVENWEKAIAQTSLELCHTLAEQINECRTALEEMVAALNTRLADLAPGMTQLRQAMEDCRSLMGLILQRKPESSPAPAAPDSVGNPASEARASATIPEMPGPTRDALYRQISMIAQKLEQLEPHSPIPFLLRRAVTLGALPFPEMIRSFVRDDGILQEMSRELGILPRE
ncbi:MAG: type VI secretion system protein TssA [Bacteroidales bacterium]|nr:type VI secretion system protein TssA [Bacteroidales bacterium]